MGNLLFIFHFSLIIFYFLLLISHSQFLLIKNPRSTHGNAAALRASMGASWYMYV